jgi:uncharacterized damage-inducible protein DinB
LLLKLFSGTEYFAERHAQVASLSPSRPQASEYAPFYANYVALASEADVLAALAKQLEDVLSLLRDLPEATANTRHAPYTWSVKQVLGHITDADREFGHRAFRFSRKDPTPVPGFDENAYTNVAPFDSCSLSELLSEFEHVRRANLLLFGRLSAEAWSQSGVASNNSVTVRALAYIVLGHTRHHLNILRKRLS